MGNDDTLKNLILELLTNSDEEHLATAKIGVILGLNYYKVQILLNSLKLENKIVSIKNEKGEYWKIKEEENNEKI